MGEPGGRPRFPWLWLAAAPLFATGWTAAVLWNNNLEGQSIDLVHHALFVGHLGTPWGAADPEFVRGYPLPSHRVAAAWNLAFGDPLRAVRAVALASLLVITLAQWQLLRAVLPGAVAALAVVGTQVLATACKVGNANHFMWDYQYNFSRAVAGAAFWVMLAALLTPPFPARRPGLNFAFALCCAVFAFAAHLAAGAVAVAALGGWCVVRWASGDRAVGLGGLAATAAAVGGFMLATDEWRHMLRYAGTEGSLPVVHKDLLRMWMPTWVVGVGVAVTRLIRARREAIPLDLTTVLLCGLIPAGLFQWYLLHGWKVRGTVAAYSHNQMLFVTFALSTLLWVDGLTRAGRWAAPRLALNRAGRVACAAAAVLAAGWGLYVVLEADARRPYHGSESDPIRVADELKPYRDRLLGHYYYDPTHGHASYYVTRAVLGRDGNLAPRYWANTHFREFAALYGDESLAGLILPPSADPAAVLGPGCPAERLGPYWRVDLSAYRRTPAFYAFLTTLPKPHPR